MRCAKLRDSPAVRSSAGVEPTPCLIPLVRMNADPTATIAHQPMGWRQVVAIGVATLLMAIDGFDVFSISFASPLIADHWGIDKASLGVVLSMELVGMGVGSIVLGAAAD